MTIKRLSVRVDGVVLQSECAEHPDIIVPELSDLRIWGVATYCLHRLRR